MEIKKEVVINPAFTSIAPYYDSLMKDVDYEEWVNYIVQIFEVFGMKPKKILDLACGTGTPTVLFAYKGFSITGVDNSPYMIEEARKKASNLSNSKFLVGDIRNLDFLKEKYDAAISIFDSLNNFLSKSELLDVFSSVRKVLEEKGIFVFDMNTIYCLKEYWGDKVKVKEEGNFLSIWRTRYIERENLSELWITVFVPDENGKYKRVDELHREKGYPPRLIERLLKESGFKEIHFFDHPTLRPLTRKSLRMTVVAR